MSLAVRDGPIPHCSSGDPAGRARDLESRILAPCCRREPIAEHCSDLARALRAEIRQRTVLGECSCEIEEDLVRRYGDGIRVGT